MDYNLPFLAGEISKLGQLTLFGNDWRNCGWTPVSSGTVVRRCDFHVLPMEFIQYIGVKIGIDFREKLGFLGPAVYFVAHVVVFERSLQDEGLGIFVDVLSAMIQIK